MDALDWIAQVVSHIPDPGEQMVRYYGWYSNASRGKRRKRGVSVPVEAEVQDTPQPDSDGEHFVRQRCRSWARLLKKIYEVDPLTCPHCGSEMQIIAWIEQSEVIRKILRHLDLWERPQRSPPPKLFPHKLATFMASLSPRQAQEIRASTDSVFWDDVPVWNGPRATSLHSSAHTCAPSFQLFWHLCLPYLLSHTLRAGSTCYAHYPA